MNWNEWTKVKADSYYLTPRIRDVCHACALSYAPFTPIPDATHAHIRMNGYIVTLYAPDEVGVQDRSSTEREWHILKVLNHQNRPTPALLFTGETHGQLFRVTRFIEGERLDAALMDAPPERQRLWGRMLGDFLVELHQQPFPLEHDTSFGVAMQSNRWRPYSDSFKRERKALIDAMRQRTPHVWVHGDLHPGNLIVTPNQTLAILDWGESMSAPMTYDLATLFWTYLDAPHFQQAVFDGMDSEALVQGVLEGTVVHDFGGDYIKKVLGTTCTLDNVRQYIKEHLLRIKEADHGTYLHSPTSTLPE